jgi:glutamyl-tRNA reductase
VLDESRAFRQQAAGTAEQLVGQHAEQFSAELEALAHQSALLKLRANAEQVREAVLEKARLALARGESPESVLESLSNQLSNKLLHTPTLALKQAALDGDTELLRAAERLFELDKHAEP